MKNLQKKVLAVLIAALVLINVMPLALSEEVIPEVEVPVVTEQPVEEVPVLTEQPVEEVPVLTEEPVEDVPVLTEAPAEETVEAPAEETATEETEAPVDGELFATLTDESDPERSIDIYIRWEGEQLLLGDKVTFVAVLHGYENTEYTIQWQYSEDNSEWEDINGANGDNFSFTVTADNCDDFWRVAVIVTDVIEG